VNRVRKLVSHQQAALDLLRALNEARRIGQWSAADYLAEQLREHDRLARERLRAREARP
jgi:hypothetical protein